MSEHEHHHDHDHDHDGDHHHGHHHDQGLSGFLRYLRFLPRMWRSEVNNAVVARLVPDGNDHVVDIGAGIGSGVVPAAETGAQVTAVEPTNYMRATLNMRKMLLQARKRISVVAGTAEHLGLPDRTATAVMAVNTLHHWSDIGLAAAEIERVLQPGGRILLVDEQFRDPAHPDYDRHDEKHEHKFEEADLDRTVAALATAGLIEVRGANETLANVPVLTFSATKAPDTV